MIATQYTVFTPYGTFTASWDDDPEAKVQYEGDSDAIAYFRTFLELPSAVGAGGARLQFDSLEPSDLTGFCQSEEHGIRVFVDDPGLLLEEDTEEDEAPGNGSVLDAVSLVERVRLTAQLGQAVTALVAATNAIERIRLGKQVGDLVMQLTGEQSAPKVRNFGWDAVKLADLSTEELNELRRQVEAEHANPKDAEGRYLEDGKPTIHLYDKKGRKKLEAITWAITYKLQEKRANAPVTLPEGWDDPLLKDARASDLVTVDDVRRKLEMKEGVFEAAALRGEPSETEIEEQIAALKVARMGASSERKAIEKYELQVAAGMAEAMEHWAKGWTLLAIGARKDREAPDGYTTAGRAYTERANQYMNSAKAKTAEARSDAAFLAALRRRNPAGAVAAPPSTIVAWHGVKRDQVDMFLVDGEVRMAPKFGAFSSDWKIEPGIWFSPDKEFAAKYGEPIAFELTYRSALRHEGPLTEWPTGYDAVYRTHGKAEGIDAALEIAVLKPEQIRLAKPIPEGAPRLPGSGEKEPEKAPSLEIIEHTTGRGKVIRGVIRRDLTYAQAKEIDPYTFRKDGGFFIRERHLGELDPAPVTPSKSSEELEAERAQAEADRLANERLREEKKRAEQAAKLREVAESTIAKAEAELGRERLANTARRARIAASVEAAHSQARAIGRTMLNLADAIEAGEAPHLAGITNRAQVELLHTYLRQAMAARDRQRFGDYSERQKHEGRAPEPADADFVEYPAPKWDSAGANRVRLLEALKGKRGAKDLMTSIRFSTVATPEEIDLVLKLLGDKEGQYQLGWWNIETAKRVRRLQRAGIKNRDDLRHALIEFMKFREGAATEDPIKKAERAIIGQKVGIDFFPTPTAVAQRMVALAGIKPGMRVLEPSAGNGNIADAVAAAGAKVDVLEISSQLRDILTAKGHNVVDHDFEAFEPAEKYDAIVMNPPFSSRKDAAHIKRAFEMLKPGGRLVAIAGEGVFFGSDRAAVDFRDWLERHGADVEQLQEGTFMDKKLLAQTGANGRLIVLRK